MAVVLRGGGGHKVEKLEQSNWNHNVKIKIEPKPFSSNGKSDMKWSVFYGTSDGRYMYGGG